jgi:hypothetical protein
MSANDNKKIIECAKDGPKLNLTSTRIIQIYGQFFNVKCLSILCQTRQDIHQATPSSHVSPV